MAAWLSAQHSAPDYSRGPAWFPNVIRPYQSQKITGTPIKDQVDLFASPSTGRCGFRLAQLRSAVLGNNLEIAAAADNAAWPTRTFFVPREAARLGVRPVSEFRAGCLRVRSGREWAMRRRPVVRAGPEVLPVMPVRSVARPRGSYDPSIAFSFSLDRTTSPLNTLVVAGLPSVDSSTTALQARFAQAFTTGTSVSVSFNNQRQNSTQKFLRFNPSVVSAFSLTVTQQLMNGAGREVNGRFLTVAERAKGSRPKRPGNKS